MKKQLVTAGPCENKYQNKLIITARGYYGDMDEVFFWQEQYSSLKEGLNDALMFEAIQSGALEIKDDLLDYMESEYGLKEDDFTNVPVDSYSYEMLPTSVDSLDMIWFGPRENAFNVELKYVSDQENAQLPT